MKRVSINRSNNIVKVSVELDLNNRKSRLHISDNKAEERFTKILDVVKSFSKFKKLTLNYDEIDYYDNMVDVYETPYIYFEKGAGKRKPTLDHVEHGCIPKDWSEYLTLSLEDPKTMKPIEVFLTQFGIALTPKQEKEVRKAMKGESSYHSEI